MGPFIGSPTRVNAWQRMKPTSRSGEGTMRVDMDGRGPRHTQLAPALRRDFAAAKRIHDFGAPIFEQAAMSQFIADGSFERHIRKASAMLRARRELMLGRAEDARRRARGSQRFTCGEAPRRLPARPQSRSMQSARGRCARQGAGFVPDCTTLPRCPAPCGPSAGLCALVGARTRSGGAGARRMHPEDGADRDAPYWLIWIGIGPFAQRWRDRPTPPMIPLSRRSFSPCNDHHASPPLRGSALG